MKIINTQRISYSNSQFAGPGVPRKAEPVDTRSARERQFAAPTAEEQRLAASKHANAEIAAGIQYQTGSRRGQQLASTRKAG